MPNLMLASDRNSNSLHALMLKRSGHVAGVYGAFSSKTSLSNWCGVRKAFTLIELMVVVFIIGIMSAIVIPRFVRKEPSTEWLHITDEINNLVYFARQEAITNRRTYRIAFYSRSGQPDLIQVESEQDDPEKPGTKQYELARSEYFKAVYQLPEGVKLNAIYEGRIEQLEENKGKAYCYIIANGVVQDVLIHIRKVVQGKESRGSFKVQPFLGMFEFEEGFVKPWL